MLTNLYLKDFAVVSEVEVAFDGGLTVVSGETGAGKSLMVDALLLLSGSRSEASLVRHGAARAELIAGFDLGDAPRAEAWLREQELLEDPAECQVRRVIRADGGSRAWINGRPATVGQLDELGQLLVEIHGQHEHQALLSRAHQLRMLDAYGGHGEALERVREHAARWQHSQRRLADLVRAGDVGERLDYLSHQLDELDAESLEPESIAELGASHRRQANAASLIEGCARAQGLLSGEDAPSPADQARGVLAELVRLSDDEPRLAEVVSMLENAAVQLEEAESSLERIRDELEIDPEQLELLETRLSRLHELARKHRVPMDELHQRREAIRDELQSLHDAGASVEALQASAAASLAAWRVAAAELGRHRRDSAAALAEAVTGLMGELGMGGGRFEIAFEALDDSRPDPQGGERIELMVSANPGVPPRPLRKVASGGELSRISLAIEVATLDRDAVATMVFDEVDTGIGGGVAEVVGQRLRALGSRRQVLCVTHLPQVAAQGHQHLRVEKAVQDQATHTRLTRLTDADRIEEIARMLGGLEITRETRAHAAQMLDRAGGSGPG